LITPKKLERAEHWLARYQSGGVFFARLLPVVRHLISIPAGIVRMRFMTFSFVTIAGSALWCWILAYLGRKAYRLEPDLLKDPEGWVRFVKGQSTWLVMVVLGFSVLYMLMVRFSKPPAGVS
jgi:membrane protein DedA with SNARE-associated domain